MIRMFEEKTAPLNSYEKKTLIPVMVACLKRHIGKGSAITNREMCEKMLDAGYTLDEIQVRKIINYIRNDNLVPCLIASQRGYYVTRDEAELEEYIKSLEDRIFAIMDVKFAMENQLEILKQELSTKDKNPDGQLAS